MNSLMSINNLKVSYGEKIIINDLNLQIYENETLTIIGKSGKGKTTFLNSILGLIPYEGIITNNNSSISYMPQDLALFDFKTVYENIVLPIKISKLEIDKEYIMEILNDLEIKDFRNTKVKDLSGGQKSRVALARALVKKDNILLLDEPLSSLDYLTKKNTLSLLTKLKQKYKITLVYVTHDIREVLEISDRILIIKDTPEVIINKNISEEDIIKQISK